MTAEERLFFIKVVLGVVTVLALFSHVLHFILFHIVK